MRINHNITALNAYRQLSVNNIGVNKSLEKLSSGMRINRAGDDAAGLAISEKMRGQIRGLNQAVRNAQDAISMIQTAEGALNEVHSILQRMRELAIQAGNDTNTDRDRAEIQKEINQLTSEINRISNTTEFNTQKLLNASSGTKTTPTDPTDPTNPGNGGGSELVAKTFIDEPLENTGVILNGSYEGPTDTDKLYIKYNATDDKYSYSTDDQNYSDITWGGDDDNEFTFNGIKLTKPENNPSSDVTDVVELMEEQPSQEPEDPQAPAPSASSSSFIMQIGANENQTMTLELSDMRAAALGISTDDTQGATGFTNDMVVTDGTNNDPAEYALDVSNAENAATAVTKIQQAIETVSAERAKLGAYQNRLEHTINNLEVAAENLTAAESRIRDVDMAKEMMEFTKQTILQQAATAMLAQANQLPQAVLQLLR
ncbi:MAG: flagellar hook-associated protein FlgL [Caldicoprobacteraceae bacterium]|jgi:flagellin